MSSRDVGTAPGPSDETEHFAFIDALRGWAFLAVLAVHVHVPGSVPAWLARVQSSGNYGVQLFFVISALTLFMSYDARRTRDRKPIPAFFLRRLFRIAPLFWLAIPFYLWQNGFGPRDSAPAGIHWPQVLSTALFLHGWHPTSINSVVPGGWSIAVEMNFYLLLPVCFALLNSLRKSILACVVALGLSTGLCSLANRWLMTLYPADEAGLIHGFLYYWLPRQMPVFLLGFLLHFLIQGMKRSHGGSTIDPARTRSASWITAIALGGLLLLVAVGHRLPLTYFLFSSVFVLLGLGLSLRPLFLLVNPLTRFVGKLSYSAYITHFFVLGQVGRITSSLGVRSFVEGHPVAALLLAYLACLGGTLAISTLTHSLIELPGQNWGKRLIRRFQWGRATPTVPQDVPQGIPGSASNASGA